MVRESSEYNHSVGQERKSRAVRERNTEKELLQAKFKTLESEMQHERDQGIVERARKRQQLARVYDS